MGMGFGSREQRKIDEVRDALTASHDLHVVLPRAYELLLPLVGAEYGALAVSPSGRADEYEWNVHNLPASFLGDYAQLARHDFVRTATLTRMNTVLRDSDMIDRRALERNLLYHRAREVGTPIEQVMAVMFQPFQP